MQDYHWLGELDPPGWAWEWLRRHPDYGDASSAAYGGTPPPSGVAEAALKGFGLHFRGRSPVLRARRVHPIRPTGRPVRTRRAGVASRGRRRGFRSVPIFREGDHRGPSAEPGTRPDIGWPRSTLGRGPLRQSCRGSCISRSGRAPVETYRARLPVARASPGECAHWRGGPPTAAQRGPPESLVFEHACVGRSRKRCQPTRYRRPALRSGTRGKRLEPILRQPALACPASSGARRPDDLGWLAGHAEDALIPCKLAFARDRAPRCRVSTAGG